MRTLRSHALPLLALLTLPLIGCPSILGIEEAKLLPLDGSVDTDSGPDAETDADTETDASETKPDGTAAEASTDARPTGETGPGPLGALPTGYCCTSNSECRNRNCMEINGSKMCADACLDATTSECASGGLPGFTCVDYLQNAFGHCAPTSSSTQCKSASVFVHGTKKLGACCENKNGSGNTCEGGYCGVFYDVGSAPYICSNACDSVQDCPGNYICQDSGEGYKFCVPSSASYTCTP